MYITAASQHLNTTSGMSMYQPFNMSVASPTLTTWHSGMSPFKYEVAVLKQCVKNCYSCEAHGKESTGKNDYRGQLHYSRDFLNTYYHLSKTHIQRNHPAFNGFVYISTNLCLTGLDNRQRDQLQSCDLQLLVYKKNFRDSFSLF